MTFRFRLSTADCITISGAQHRVRSQDASGIILERVDDATVNQSFSHEAIVRLLAAPDVALLRGHFTVQSAELRLRCDTRYIATLAEPVQAKVLWKTAWVEAFRKAERAGKLKRTYRSIAKAMPMLKDEVDAREHSSRNFGKNIRAGLEVISRHPPCPKTLLTWVTQYEEFGATPLALLPKRRLATTYHRRFSGEAEELIAECINGFLDRGGPTMRKIIRDTHQQFRDVNEMRARERKPYLRVPSIRTIERRIAVFGKFETTAYRKGLACAMHKFAFYENGISAVHPMQRIEMDDYEVDVMTLLGSSGALAALSPRDRAKFDVGRRQLCLAVDCATRYALSFRLTDNPSTKNAMATLQMITQDKTPIAEAAGCQSDWSGHGGIGTLVTDQGSTFTALEFRSAVADLGGTYEAPPAGVPKLRGTIERVFRTLGQQLAPMLIGRTFSNIVERGDYPSEKLAALTDDDLAQIFTLFFVDIYNNSPHEGLCGETPANAWKRLAAEQGVTPPPDSNHRRAVFGLKISRKLDRHGVRAFGINYTCPKLQQLLLHGRQTDVTLRVDPDDLTYISALIGNDWHPAKAVNQAVWGLSLDEWQAIVRDLRTTFKKQARLTEHIIFRARRKIMDIDARARELRRVMPPQLTPADLDRAENNLFLGLTIGPEGSSANKTPTQGSGDLLDDVIHAPVAPMSRINPEGAGVHPLSDSVSPKSPWRITRD